MSSRNRYLLSVCTVVIVATSWSALRCFAAEEPAEQDQTPDVIYLPTPQDVVERMLKEVKVTKTDVVYDLGCGDGRIVVTAAKTYGCRCTGFDIDPERIADSQKNVASKQVEKLVSIQKADIFKLDLSKANVITLYLLPDLNVRLIPQLLKLKPGSRIVSHDFDMRGVKPDRIIKMRSKEDEMLHRIYVWTAPLTVAPRKGKGRAAADTFAIVKIDGELVIKKSSEVTALRKETLTEYKAALKAWRKAKKEAGAGPFTTPQPKRSVIETVAADLSTEEDAAKKLEEFKKAEPAAAAPKS